MYVCVCYCVFNIPRSLLVELQPVSFSINEYVMLSYFEDLSLDWA